MRSRDLSTRTLADLEREMKRLDAIPMSERTVMITKRIRDLSEAIDEIRTPRRW